MLLLVFQAWAAGWLGPAATPAPAARLRRVRQQVAAIQQQRLRLRPVRPDQTQPGPEGNDLVGYFAGSALWLLHEVHAGDSGERQADYYFTAGRLIFVYERETRYGLPQPSGRPTLRIQESRSYFEDGHLFCWLGFGGRPRRLQTAAARARQQALLHGAQALRRQVGAVATE